jgi:GH43 family beta-xylosidase
LKQAGLSVVFILMVVGIELASPWPAAACEVSRVPSGPDARSATDGDCHHSWPEYTLPITQIESGGNIVWHDGYYYMPVKSRAEPRIRMVKARWLKDFAFIKDNAAIKAQKVVWEETSKAADAFINWPVMLTRLHGRWYIYMDGASRNPPGFTDRLMVLQADTDDPMGSWTLKTSLLGEDVWTIGFAPFEWRGQLYIMASTRKNHVPGTRHAISIASLSNPWTASSDWVPITDPTYAWEKVGPRGAGTAAINEVDQAITHNGRLHVFYSASHVTSQHYTVGLLTYKGSGSLLDRDNWTKRPTPIWNNTDATVGAGQTFVLKSPDLSEDYLGYAYWRTPTTLSPRPMGIVPIRWDADDYPVVDDPPDVGTQFDEPSSRNAADLSGSR